MKFKIIAPASILCLSISLGLVGCNGNDMGIDDGNNSSVDGEALSNQLNGIFGGYGTDGNNTNDTNSNNNINGLNPHNFDDDFSYNDEDLGFHYGYSDGLDIGDDYSLGGNYNRNYTLGGKNNGNYTSSRFGVGLPGAENIIGNGVYNNKYSTSLNNSLMS